MLSPVSFCRFPTEFEVQGMNLIGYRFNSIGPFVCVRHQQTVASRVCRPPIIDIDILISLLSQPKTDEKVGCC